MESRRSAREKAEPLATIVLVFMSCVEFSRYAMKRDLLNIVMIKTRTMCYRHPGIQRPLSSQSKNIPSSSKSISTSLKFSSCIYAFVPNSMRLMLKKLSLFVLIAPSFLWSKVDFVHEVMPILKKNFGIHTDGKKKGGLDMNTRSSFLAGGKRRGRGSGQTVGKLFWRPSGPKIPTNGCPPRGRAFDRGDQETDRLGGRGALGRGHPFGVVGLGNF